MTERRAAIRQKSFMHGVVYFNHRRSTADCLVRDFNETGAHLRFNDIVTLPDAFELHIPAKDLTFQAQMIWHKGNDIGVSFKREDAPPLVPEAGQALDPIHDRLAKLEHQVAVLKKRLDALQGE